MSQLNDPAAAAPAAVAVDPNALQALLQPLTAVVSNVLVGSTTAMKQSTSIDPYNNTSMGAKKKYGKYQWPVVTKMMGGWKLVTVNV